MGLVAIEAASGHVVAGDLGPLLQEVALPALRAAPTAGGQAVMGPLLLRLLLLVVVALAADVVVEASCSRLQRVLVMELAAAGPRLRAV